MKFTVKTDDETMPDGPSLLMRALQTLDLTNPYDGAGVISITEASVREGYGF
jgi:hypothetical protein